MKKILAITLLILSATNAQAGALSNYWENLKTNTRDAWNCGSYELLVPVNIWHNRWAYDQESIDRYNEMPWGAGLGRGIWKGNEWHGLYFMVFKDSNYREQTIGGYAYVYNWGLTESNNLKAGIGYTLSLTQRHDYTYIPVPLPLPLASISYKRAAIQAAYVPGLGKNDGNVLFTWFKWTF